jgi:hypothetical protein
VSIENLEGYVMEDQQDRITELEAQVASLSTKLEELATNVAPQPAASVVDTGPHNGSVLTEDVAPTGSRRNLFKLAAGAAAGGTAFAIAKSAGPVAATDGQSVLIGDSRTQGNANSRSTTVVDYEGASGPQVPGPLIGGFSNANIMLVRDRPGGVLILTPDSSSYPAAVAGYAYRAVANGLFGLSANGGAGLVGYGAGAGTTGVLARGSRANIEMFPAGDAPSTRTDAHKLGELVTDTAGDLWCCVAAGSPGSWRKLAGPMSAGAFHAIAPKRVYDSRVGKAPNLVAKGKLNPGQNRVVDCTEGGAVPSTSKAVVLNLTAANTTGTGNLAVYPDGSPPPPTSSINYTGLNIANSTTSGCGPGAKVRVQCGATGATGADFIIDILGYYV